MWIAVLKIKDLWCIVTDICRNICSYSLFIEICLFAYLHIHQWTDWIAKRLIIWIYPIKKIAWALWLSYMIHLHTSHSIRHYSCILGLWRLWPWFIPHLYKLSYEENVLLIQISYILRFVIFPIWTAQCHFLIIDWLKVTHVPEKRKHNFITVPQFQDGAYLFYMNYFVLKINGKKK